LQLGDSINKMIKKKDIELAAQYIREGKLVAFPTETVYGLGANALDPIAVAKIFEVKERPSFDPLIIHIASLEDISRYAYCEDPRVELLAKHFWPGPLTLILPKKPIVPDIVTSGLSSVGIRMPAVEIALDLIRLSGCPIAAPSANKFGRISPTTAQHVRNQLPNVDYILDGGRTSVGIESTIVKLTEKGFQILRKGIILKEDIEQFIPFDSTSVERITAAPGMLKSHYSPTKTTLIITAETLHSIDASASGLISFSGQFDSAFKKVIRLTQNNDLKEFAAGMFEAMHCFEGDPEIMSIAVEAVPETGVGTAIMDRLRKAEYAHKNQETDID